MLDHHSIPFALTLNHRSKHTTPSLPFPFKKSVHIHKICACACIIIHNTTQHIVYVNRQARVALGDRIRNSLQLTALRLKPSRLLGVQALTLHYP
jgi:hypothetical protein